MKRYAGLGLLILAAACSPQSKKVGDNGSVTKQTKQDLVAQLKQQGVFDSVQTSAIDKNFEIVSTMSDEQFYVKDGVVVSSSRKPKKRETSLLYWRYQFKGKGYRESDVNGSGTKGHVMPHRQLACDEMGMGVVYNPSTDQVTRVFYYENK